MNLDLLYQTITGFGRNINDVEMIYDFTKVYSGGLIFNEKYSTGEQFDYPGRSIYPEKKMGITTTCTTLQEDDEFDYDPTRSIKILGMDGLQNWTAFFKLKFNVCELDPASRNRIIFFNKDSLSSKSGIVLSLDDGNKFVLEYDSQFKNTLVECNKEAIFSLERNNTFLNFNLYYPNFYDYKESYIQKPADKNVNTWYLGGYNEYNDIYTGLGPSGKTELDFFLLFNKSLDIREKLDISKVLLSSGSVLTSGFYYYDEVYISGDNIITGGNIGAGVTGERLVLIGQETGVCFSEIFYVYQNSGMTGYITGEIIVSNIVPITGTYTGVQFFNTLVYKYDLDNFYENNIIFTQNNKILNLDTKDIYELYAFDNTGEGYPYNIYYNNLNNKYVMNDLVPNKYIYFYINGVLQKSGLVVDNHFKTNGREIEHSLIDVKDFGSYRYYTGFTGFSTGISDIDLYPPASNIILSDFDYSLVDAYLNGQKLISGINYDIFGSSIRLYRDTIAEGEISFYPKIQSRDYLTGNKNYINLESGVPEEFLWFNGIKLEKGIDYRKVSCLGILKNTDYNLISTGNIWNSDLNGFFELN